MAWRVLVVDDEEEVRKVLRLHLTKEGYEVIEATDVKQAIQKVQEGDNPLRLNAIVCDIRMPKISGTEAIDYFRREFPSIPIIVLTGFIDVQLAVDLMKKGVTDYLVKPVPKEQLIAAVQKALGVKKPGSEQGRQSFLPGV
jgi:two-component system chemotaxis response regulator CheY